MQQPPTLPELFLYILVNGLPLTLLITAIGLGLGFILGLAIALARVYGTKIMDRIAYGYEKILRGIPVIVIMYLFVYGFPGLFWFVPTLQRPFVGIILALGLRSGAYQGQLLRGAILSVEESQVDAALAMGMTQMQATQHIVLPQALRLAVPSWSNEYAVVLKDSSFAYELGQIELLKTAYRIVANFPALWFPAMIMAGIVYFIVTYPITSIIGERQKKKLKQLGMGGGE